MRACGCRITLPGHEGELVGEYCRMHEAAPDLLALLREYAQKGADVVDPEPGSLLARTRALLATLDAAP